MSESTENNGTQTAAGQGSGTSAAEPKTVAELPQWAQELISKTRQEAADYRTRLREAKDEVRGEIKVEFEQQLNELNGKLAEKDQLLADTQLNSTKLEVALDAGLAGQQALAFAKRLRGTTKEELEADAKEALAIFGTPGTSRATDPSQGLGSEPAKDPAQIMGEFIASRLGK